MLCVFLASPPVPQVSMAPSGARTGTAMRPQGPRRAGDLVDRLAAHAQSHQQRADLRIASPPPT